MPNVLSFRFLLRTKAFKIFEIFKKKEPQFSGVEAGVLDCGILVSEFELLYGSESEH